MTSGAAIWNLMLAAIMVAPAALGPFSIEAPDVAIPAAPPVAPGEGPAVPPGELPQPQQAPAPKPMSLENDTLVIEVMAGVYDTLDPAVAYDDYSGAVIQAVYETLITYDGSYADRFVPVLAEEVPSVQNGLISADNLTYTFHIRRGITFHSGDTLNASDVAYSFRRVLLIDYPSGPAWILSQVLDVSSIRVVDDYTVEFTLTRPFGAFISTLAYTVGSIVSEQTVEANGGTVPNQQNIWMQTHMDGTGPWTLGPAPGVDQVRLDRAPSYWNATRAAKLSQVYIRQVADYATALSDFQSGAADIIPVPSTQRTAMAALAADPAQNISLSSGAPTWSVTTGAFNYAINTSRRSQMGSLPYPDDVPSDFFSDPMMRRAFAHAFDYDAYLAAATNGYSVRLNSVIPQGLFGYAANVTGRTYDLAAAQDAYNQSQWVVANGLSRGFNITAGYNCGNTAREAAVLLLKAGVELLGPNIHVNAKCWDFATYLDLTLSTPSGTPGPVPVFFIGWGPDYADPDDYVIPFLRTGATYPQWTGWSNVTLDALLDEASMTPDSAARLYLYWQIQRSVVDADTMLWIAHATNFHMQSTVVRGWYYNPMLSAADLGGNLAALRKTDATLTSVIPASVPSVTFTGHELLATWDIVVPGNASAGTISETAVYFDTVTHAPGPFDRASYPMSANGVVTGTGSFEASLVAPALPGTLHLIFYARVGGVDYYNDTEWTVDVRAAPRLTANLNLTEPYTTAQRPANLTLTISWPDPEPFSAIRVLWDTNEHATPQNQTGAYTTLYPTQSGPAGNYTFQFPAASGGRFYYAYAADIFGVTFLSEAEYNVTIVAEPLVARDTSPPWVFAGRNATVAWSVFADVGISYTTELKWDTTSHPTPRDASNYPQTSGIRSGTGTDSFSHVIDTPTAGNVYFLFVVHWNAQDIYVAALSGNAVEFRIEVRAAPVLTVPALPPIAFVGRNVTVSANFAWAYAGDADLIAIVFDNAGHGSPPQSAAAYGNSVVRANVSAGTYVFTLDAPASPGILYFAVHMRVGGIDILSANEYQVTVSPLPVLILTLPNWTLPQAVAVATLDVQWPTGGALDSVALHYDTVAHGSALDPARYASSTPAQGGVPGNFSFTINTPSLAGTLYVLAAVEISTYLFTTAAEAALPVAEPPTVTGPTMDPHTGYALLGQPIEVSWTVNFSYSIQVSSDFRWDTASHAGAGMSFSDYPQASPLLTQLSTSTFTTTFNAPNASGTLHSIVRVLLLGRNFYSEMEVNVTVLPNPVLKLDAYPTKVIVGEPIEIRWSANFTGPHTLIPHTAIHWGLVSKAPIPPSITNYPGVGAPFRGIIGTEFNTTLPAQPSPGPVYFIVHVVVNGMHFYMEDEHVVEVALAPGSGGGGFLPGLEGASTVMAIAGAAVLLASRSRRSRRT